MEQAAPVPPGGPPRTDPVRAAAACSARLQRRLLEHCQILIYRVRFHPIHHFEYVSPASTDLVGFAPDEFYADPGLLLRLVHADDRASLEQAFEAQAESVAVAARLYAKDGRLRWTEHLLAPILDANSRLLGVEGAARDLTRDRQMSALLHELSNHLSLTTGFLDLVTQDPLLPDHVSPPLTQALNGAVQASQALFRLQQIAHQSQSRPDHRLPPWVDGSNSQLAS
jgi:PAS domain S-box-containing protein